MKVNFNNSHNIFIKRKILRVFLCAEKELSLNKNYSANITFVTPEQIKQMNSEYRQKDTVTDVLSFPLEDEIANPKTSEIDLGDIVICKKRAKEQAKEYSHSLTRELCFLSLHGLLHLLGYDHQTKPDEKKMFTLQNKILEKCNLKR